LKKSRKIRLDLLLQQKYPELSRNRIQSLIMAGTVKINGSPVDKPGTTVDCAAEVQISEPDNPYVSRGGLKLAGAILDFKMDVRQLTVVDIGASTGGFTDCLLQSGARKVYAVDVGYGQLDYKLRNDPRVVPLEKFNVRNLKPENIPEKTDLAVVDVSFISLKLVFPVLKKCEISKIVALVKPQFEVGRIDAAKGKGVIRDPLLHEKVLGDLLVTAAENGYQCRQLAYSHLVGPKGNLEYFMNLELDAKVDSAAAEPCRETIKSVVQEAHLNLLSGDH
jgi:23S rRNA (cytidine1920-2'-O)/16S rRNA (cytidine1409-2'-O)-methyltransferase